MVSKNENGQSTGDDQPPPSHIDPAILCLLQLLSASLGAIGRCHAAVAGHIDNTIRQMERGGEGVADGLLDLQSLEFSMAQEDDDHIPGDFVDRSPAPPSPPAREVETASGPLVREVSAVPVSISARNIPARDVPSRSSGDAPSRDAPSHNASAVASSPLPAGSRLPPRLIRRPVPTTSPSTSNRSLSAQDAEASVHVPTVPNTPPQFFVDLSKEQQEALLSPLRILSQREESSSTQANPAPASQATLGSSSSSSTVTGRVVRRELVEIEAGGQARAALVPPQNSPQLAAHQQLIGPPLAQGHAPAGALQANLAIAQAQTVAPDAMHPAQYYLPAQYYVQGPNGDLQLVQHWLPQPIAPPTVPAFPAPGQGQIAHAPAPAVFAQAAYVPAPAPAQVAPPVIAQAAPPPQPAEVAPPVEHPNAPQGQPSPPRVVRPLDCHLGRRWYAVFVGRHTGVFDNW